MIIIRTVAEMWPEHEGHDVRYSEFGRTDYRLIEVELNQLHPVEPDNGVREFQVCASSYESEPIDGRIDETSLWCADCGERFSDWREEEVTA